MTGKQRFRRYLVWTFWISLVFTAGFIWYYMERQIPEQLSIVAREQEEFRLDPSL